MAAWFWLLSFSLLYAFGASPTTLKSAEEKHLFQAIYLTPTTPEELKTDASAVGARTAVMRLSHLSVTAKRGHGGRLPLVGRLLMILILLGGDIELNPGPVMYPCTVCSKQVTDNHEAICCDSCDLWTHARCCDICYTEYCQLSCDNNEWFCPTCVRSELPYANASLSFSANASLPFNANLARVDNSMGPSRAKLLSCLSVNARNLLPKLDELRVVCEAECLDIVCVTETWLCDDIGDSEISIPGFKVFRKDRSRHSGGTLIYVRDSIPSTPHSISSTSLCSDLELILLSITLPQMKLTLGSFYRPPNSSLQYFLDFQQILEMLDPSDLRNLVVCGDFNIDVSSDVNHTPIHSLLDQLLAQFSFSQVVDGATRITRDCSSTLDLVLLTNPQSLHSCTVTPPLANSDHQSISFQLKQQFRLPKLKKSKRQEWIYKDVDLEHANSLFNSVNQNFVLGSNVDESWTRWKSAFLSVVSSTIPSKVVPSKDNLPWLSRVILMAMRKRNQLYKSAKRNHSPWLFQRYRALRNKVVGMVREAKKNYYQDLAASRPNPKKFWGLVKKIQSSSQSIPSQLNHGGSMAFSPAEKASMLNKYFSECFNQERVFPLCLLPIITFTLQKISYALRRRSLPTSLLFGRMSLVAGT